jgi:CHASE2 domain-containing sensor protein/two-component sensor histidine kinase
VKKFSINDYFSTALILLLLVLLLHFSGILSRVDNLIYDVGQKLNHQAAPSDVVIVAIDENSLSQLGRWPWSRNTHANLIRRLKAEGASVIGMDVIFSEPDNTNKGADEDLAQAIYEAKNVVLPVLLESTRVNGQVIETLPLPNFADNAADLGRVHAVLDEDGIARSIYLYEGVGVPVWQHFSQAILNVAQQQVSKNQFSLADQPDKQAMFLLAQQAQRKINFLGPPGHFLSISYVQVLNGQFEKGLFNNKIVLVGATASGMNDLLSTPVSGLGLPMAGVEVHANVLQSIRDNKLIQQVSPGYSVLILLCLVLVPFFWLPKLPALASLIATLVFFVFISFIASMLPKLVGIWVPPSAALLPILLAYPIWSWRKLEQARKYLDYELSYLKQNLIDIPAIKNTNNFDSFNAQIEQVRNASQQLRFLQNDRKELLAFISHDLRAPIANALMILDEKQVEEPRLHASLTQAHTLAEDFLQASRAEMIDNTKFREIDFASLTHQAADDAYEAAKKKNITLQRDILDGQVWINGNFGLLQRAVLNLILNAVKFSPTDAVVQVKLVFANRQAVMSVINGGLGIPINEQLFLFKRFSRVSTGEAGTNGASAATEGTGLGLYFVQTVAEKHHGYAEVESDIGKDTCFSLRLPVSSYDANQPESAQKTT